MTNELGAPASRPGSREPSPSVSAASGFDPSRKSVLGRLSDGFTISIATTAETGTMHLNGPINSQDELDALVTVLGVVRGWLTPPSDSDRSGEAGETGTGSTVGESAGRNEV
jgi:hypothetical protein